MTWIKNVLVDLAITLLIVLATTLDLSWAQWIVLIYTPLMVILKMVALLGSKNLSHLKQKETGVPVWFYHVLYAVNVAFSAGSALMNEAATVYLWWLIASGWLLIWVLSIATDVRSRPATSRS